MEVFRLDFVAGADDDGPFDDVFQLADIAGPGVFVQELNGNVGKPLLKIVFLIELAQKRQGQGGNILFAEPQGRDGNGKDCEAIV